MNVYFAVCAAGDVDVAGGIGQFHADGGGDGVAAIEGAANRRPVIAAGQNKEGRKKDERKAKFAVTRHPSSINLWQVVLPLLIATQKPGIMFREPSWRNAVRWAKESR